MKDQWERFGNRSENYGIEETKMFKTSKFCLKMTEFGSFLFCLQEFYNKLLLKTIFTQIFEEDVFLLTKLIKRRVL